MPRGYFFDDLTPGVARAVDAAIDRLRSSGCPRRDVALPVSGALYDTMFGPIAVSRDPPHLRLRLDLAPRGVLARLRHGVRRPGPSAAEVSRAHQAREAFERAVAVLFADVDILAMPAVPTEAPPIDGPIDGMRVLRNTWPFNAARVPADLGTVRCR